MSLREEFDAAADRVKTLSSRPDNQTLLNLYALYKQGTDGDVTGKKPGRLKIADRAKFEAWEARKGMSKDDAMQAYVELVDELVAGDS